MKVKCWRCGAENDSESQWCESCASWMIDIRDSEEIRLDAPGTVTRVLRNMGKVILVSAILALTVIGAMIAVVGIYDFIINHRMLVGIGKMLFVAGLLLVFSSFLSGRTDPKSMILTDYNPRRTRRPYAVFHRTIINPALRTMRLSDPNMSDRMLVIQMIAGLIVFAVGSCIDLLSQ